MGWTSLFLNMSDKKVFILGTGEVAHRRANKFLDDGAEVILSGNTISKDLKSKGAILKPNYPKEDLKKWIDWADIVVTASGNNELNDYVSFISNSDKKNTNPKTIENISSISSSNSSSSNNNNNNSTEDSSAANDDNETKNSYCKKLVNRADTPEKGDLIVPTSFYIEDIQVSIFTNGKSPLMARELRKKIQKLINNEDILQIKLQDYTRNILKVKVHNQKDRKKYLYEILEDEAIKKLLKEEKLEDAEKYVNSLLNRIKQN